MSDSKQMKCIAGDRQVADDMYPLCRCFNGGGGYVLTRHAQANSLGSQIADALGVIGICPSAAPYFLVQVFSFAIGSVATVALEEQTPEDVEMTAEQAVCAAEDHAFLWATKIASLLPDMVATHSAQARHSIAESQPGVILAKRAGS